MARGQLEDLPLSDTLNLNLQLKKTHQSKRLSINKKKMLKDVQWVRFYQKVQKQGLHSTVQSRQLANTNDI